MDNKQSPDAHDKINWLLQQNRLKDRKLKEIEMHLRKLDRMIQQLKSKS